VDLNLLAGGYLGIKWVGFEWGVGRVDGGNYEGSFGRGHGSIFKWPYYGTFS
jgi:hypothetical protein